MSASASGASAASRDSSSAVRAARKRFGRQKSTTPALKHSPRSILGTTRITAYWKGLSAGAGTLGLLRKAPGRFQAREQILGVVFRRRDAVPRQPVGGDLGDQGFQHRGIDAPAEAAVGLLDGGGGRQEHVFGDRRKRTPRVGGGTEFAVLVVERGAVVDQP